MRNLLILTGPSGTGKSSFVRENNLEDSTLSLDTLRKLHGGTHLDLEGNINYIKNTPTLVREFFSTTLNNRMSSGEFLVVDATNLLNKDFAEYLRLGKKHGYSLYYKQFSGDAESSFKNVKARAENFVSLSSIERQYERLKSLEIPSKFKKIEEVEEMFTLVEPMNYVGTKVYVIGDIHGCIDVLNEFLDKEYDSSCMYIFAGDYVDRGPDSKAVLQRLRVLERNPNVVLLEGNHERWLRYWGNSLEENIRNVGFKKDTIPNLESTEDGTPAFRKSQARDFCHRLKLFSYLNTSKGRLYVSHGGGNFVFDKNKRPFHSEHYIKGEGNYKDLDLVYDQGSYQADIVVHGHRNIGGHKESILHSANTKDTHYINLEGSVEKGGDLRYAIIPGNEEDQITLNYISSDYNYLENIDTLLVNLRSRPQDILERECTIPGIKSFNFSRDVFIKKNWTSLNCTARGLFIDEVGKTVVGRGYAKYFNHLENATTSEAKIKKASYPLKLYTKYNGFLGLVYAHKGELIFNSKAGDHTDFAKRFKEIFYNSTTPGARAALIDVLASNNLTATFEVQIPDRENLTYFSKTSTLTLLDLIYNEVVFSKMSFGRLVQLYNLTLAGTKIGCKELVKKVDSYDELLQFFVDQSSIRSEGYVIEDSSVEIFMFKWKAPIYNLMKLFRGFIATKNRSTVYNRLAQSKQLDVVIGNLCISKSEVAKTLNQFGKEGAVLPPDLSNIMDRFILK